MQRIRVLSDHTINKIAAGEVIENPSSVVKELVENSLDAGASSICVEIQGGGRQLIRISDDGCGMSADDAVLCLERHATSKIKEVEDIESLLTMGFRGEAIPSIASISKFTLLTATKSENGQEPTATMVIVDGGKLMSASPAVRSQGTTIEVKTLFFNVPVRRKFQRSSSYDAQEIHRVLNALALGHPGIQFELISDQRQVFRTSAGNRDLPFLDQLKQRIEEILGKEYAHSLKPLVFENELYKLQGFIGLPSHHRPNRSGQHLLINQRAVYSALVSAGVREGYGPMLPSQRFPVFVLHMQLEGHLVDVNVHPQKREVRLRHESHLKQILIQAVQKSLGIGIAPALPPPPSTGFTPENEPIFASPTPSTFYRKLVTPPPAQQKEEWVYTPAPRMEISIPEAPPVQASLPLPKAMFIPRVIHTLPGYLVLNQPPEQLSEDALCLVDQRCAYARIAYEQLEQQDPSKSAQQLLLLPLSISFSPMESEILKENLESLQNLGFNVREAGEGVFLVESFPRLLQERQVADSLRQIITELQEGQAGKQLQQKRQSLLAWAACKASLPASKKLTIDEGQSLVDQLFRCGLPMQCPMGKQTICALSTKDLSKFF